MDSEVQVSSALFMFSFKHFKSKILFFVFCDCFGWCSYLYYQETLSESQNVLAAFVITI